MKTWLLVTSTLNQSVQFKLCKVILATVLLTVSNAFAGSSFYPSSDFLGTNFNKQTNAANARTAIAATGFQDVTNIVQSIATGGTNFPYTAITNSPWVLTNDFLSASNILQIQINANTSGLQFKTTTNGVNGILIASNFLQTIPVSATNQFATTNLVAASTNGLPSRIWTLGDLSQSNSITSNNISGAINIGQVFGAPTTNGFVTSSITNGLATTNYVNTATNGHVTASITNGLATTNFVLGQGFITSANGGNAALATNLVANVTLTNPVINAGSGVSLFVTGTNATGTELVVSNANSSSFAGFTAQANNGTFGTNYLFMGINNSAYVPSSTVIGTTNSGIIEMNGGDLYFDMIGATNRNIFFGNRTSTNTAFATFATLNGSNGLTLSSGQFTGNGAGLTNVFAANNSVTWEGFNIILNRQGGNLAVDVPTSFAPFGGEFMLSFLPLSGTNATGQDSGSFIDCLGRVAGTNVVMEAWIYTTNAATIGVLRPRFYFLPDSGTNWLARMITSIGVAAGLPFSANSTNQWQHLKATNSFNFFGNSGAQYVTSGNTSKDVAPTGYNLTNLATVKLAAWFDTSITNGTAYLYKFKVSFQQ